MSCKRNPQEITVHIQPHNMEEICSSESNSEVGAGSVKSEKMIWVLIAVFAVSLGAAIGLGYSCLTAIGFVVAPALGADTKLTAWTLGAWNVAASISFVICGHLSDVFGRREIILTGQALTIVGFIICAAAKNVQTLIAGQTLLGLSCGFVWVVYAAATELLPNKRRSIGVGIIDMGFMWPWSATAALIATALLLYSTWRWLFYMGIIFETLGMFAVIFLYQPKSPVRLGSDESIRQKLRQLDYVGITLYTAGITILLTGFIWAGVSTDSWSQPKTIATIVVGSFLLLTTFLYDWIVANKPVFPWALFKLFRKFTVLLVVTFTTGFTFFPLLSLLPQGLRYQFTSNSIQIGVLCLPQTMGQGIFIILATCLVSKIRHLKYQLVGLLSLQLICNIASASTWRANNGWSFVFIPAVYTSCYGWISILVITTISLHVPYSTLGVAIALTGTFRTAAGAIGVAILKLVFEKSLERELGERFMRILLNAGLSTEQVPALVANAQYGLNLSSLIPQAPDPVLESLQQAVHMACSLAFQKVFWVILPFTVVGLLAVAFSEDASKLLNNHVELKTPQQLKETSTAEEPTV